MEKQNMRIVGIPLDVQNELEVDEDILVCATASKEGSIFTFLNKRGVEKTVSAHEARSWGITCLGL